MTTAKSYFSMKRFTNAYFDALRRHKGAGIFYGAMTVFFLPLQYILTLANSMDVEDKSRYFLGEMMGMADCYNGVSAFFFPALTLVAAIVIPVNILSFMHNRRSVDVYHSLPYTRDELLLSHTAASLTLMYIPLVISFAVMAGCSVMMQGASASMILLDMVCWMVAIFVTVAFSAFVSVQVGTTFDTAAFSLVLNGSLAAIYLTIVTLSSSFLYGYDPSNYNLELAYRLSPVSLIVGRVAIDGTYSKYVAENNIAFLLWFIAGIAVLAGAVFMYRHRKSEQAEVLGTMGPLAIYVRTVGTLLAGLGMGAIFCGVFNLNSNMQILAMMGVGSMIAYFVGDVILTRSVRGIKKSLPAAAAVSLVVCALAASIMFDVYGFEKRVPAVDSIAEVDIGTYRGQFEEFPQLRSLSGGTVLKTPEAIKAVTDLQRAQVASYLAETQDRSLLEVAYRPTGDSITISYKLKSGAVMERRYYGLYAEAIEEVIKLDTNPEMLAVCHPLFSATADDIINVGITNIIGSDGMTLTLNLAQKAALIEAVKTDLLAQTPDDFRNMKALAILEVTIPYEPYLLNAEENQELRVGARSEPATVAYDYKSGTGGRPNTAVADMAISDKFKETIALVKALGGGDILQNPIDKIKTAHIKITPFRSVLEVYRPSTLESLDDIYIYSNYAEKGAILEGYSEYVDSIKLTQEQLTSLYPKFVNARVSSEAYATVAIVPTEQMYNGEPVEYSEDNMYGRVEGYYYLPIAALDEALKSELIRVTYINNGPWILRENGIILSSEEEQALEIESNKAVSAYQ